MTSNADDEPRWSGHETDDMRAIGSSLLFPSAHSELDFGLQEFALSPGSLMDCLRNSVPRGQPYKKAFLMTFRARPLPAGSSNSTTSTLCAPCVVAGVCELKPECLEEFTTIHLPGKEQRKLGRTVTHSLNWHGVTGGTRWRSVCRRR